MPIIVREDMRGSKFLQALGLDVNILRFSRNIKPNFIFESHPSSLALLIVFIRDEASFNDALTSMNELQRGFKNCFCIVVTKDVKHFLEVNTQLTGGIMRLHWAVDHATCLELVRLIHGDMCTPEAIAKLKGQAAYFLGQRDQLCSELAALHVYETSLASLSVNRTDMDIIRDGFPSISKLVSADLDTLKMRSPASLQSLENISSFFQA
jgi:hypothetical protein